MKYVLPILLLVNYAQGQTCAQKEKSEILRWLQRNPANLLKQLTGSSWIKLIKVVGSMLLKRIKLNSSNFKELYNWDRPFILKNVADNFIKQNNGLDISLLQLNPDFRRGGPYVSPHFSVEIKNISSIFPGLGLSKIRGNATMFRRDKKDNIDLSCELFWPSRVEEIYATVQVGNKVTSLSFRSTGTVMEHYLPSITASSLVKQNPAECNVSVSWRDNNVELSTSMSFFMDPNKDRNVELGDGNVKLAWNDHHSRVDFRLTEKFLNVSGETDFGRLSGPWEAIFTITGHPVLSGNLTFSMKNSLANNGEALLAFEYDLFEETGTIMVDLPKLKVNGRLHKYDDTELLPDNPHVMPNNLFIAVLDLTHSRGVERVRILYNKEDRLSDGYNFMQLSIEGPIFSNIKVTYHRFPLRLQIKIMDGDKTLQITGGRNSWLLIFSDWSRGVKVNMDMAMLEDFYVHFQAQYAGPNLILDDADCPTELHRFRLKVSSEAFLIQLANEEEVLFDVSFNLNSLRNDLTGYRGLNMNLKIDDFLHAESTSALAKFSSHITDVRAQVGGNEFEMILIYDLYRRYEILFKMDQELVLQYMVVRDRPHPNEITAFLDLYPPGSVMADKQLAFYLRGPSHRDHRLHFRAWHEQSRLEASFNGRDNSFVLTAKTNEVLQGSAVFNLTRKYAVEEVRFEVNIDKDKPLHPWVCQMFACVDNIRFEAAIEGPKHEPVYHVSLHSNSILPLNLLYIVRDRNSEDGP